MFYVENLEKSQNKIRSLEAIKDSLKRKIKKNNQINEELEQQLTMSWRKKQKNTIKMSDLRSQISRQKKFENENKNKIYELNSKLDPKHILKRLGELGITSLILEGGSKLIKSFF